jgi:hypothetical protein
MIELRNDHDNERNETKISHNLLIKQIEYIKEQYLLIIKEAYKFNKPEAEEELKNVLDSFELMLQLSNKEELIKKQ